MSVTHGGRKVQKRILAINDISCVGRCSLTVALPVISAAGFETSILPTALLSTHTGGLPGFTFLDLTDQMLPIAEHWKKLDLRFDAIFTGYLGSKRQLEIVEEIISMFRGDDTLVFVDPVMGDNGELYTNFDSDFPTGMAELCSVADIIVPNMTEASLLTGERYMDGACDREYLLSMAKKLSELGPKKVVISGADMGDGRIGTMSYDSDGDDTIKITDRIEGFYPGTGDVFSSCLLAAAMCGRSLSDAVSLAVDFTYHSIKKTKDAGTDKRFGVEFETGLSGFHEMLTR